MLDALPASRSLGEILALASGLVWAIAVILFRISGRRVHPIGLNLAKCLLALVIIIPTLAVLGEPLAPAVPASTVGLLLLSGVLGIAVSDTLFFYALNKLGASLTAIVDCFYTPFVIGLSFLLLGERLTPIQLVGAALVVSAVLTLSKEGQDREARPERPRRRHPLRHAGHVLRRLGHRHGQARPGFGLGILGHVRPDRGRRDRPRRPRPLPQEQDGPSSPRSSSGATGQALVPAAFFGSYLSLILWMGGMKYAKASVAAVLNQLNTIFIVIIAAIFLKERLTGWKVLAVVLALVGAYLASMSV